MTSPEQTSSRQRALVFVGPMGAGKTSIGKRVARRLGRPFVDTDKAIAAEHGPIPAIFEQRGEAGFRAVERAAVLSALTEGGVIALGGGAVLDAVTRAELSRHDVVLLTVDARTVRGRLRGGRGRPLLGAEDPVRRWERIAAERMPLYEEVADAVFDTSRGPLLDVVDAVVTWTDGRERGTA
ncbi:MAG: shikimate kinase [Chloroflexota bacterium]|nr:shikimate kinase [Chloroflexota bacterium]